MDGRTSSSPAMLSSMCLWDISGVSTTRFNKQTAPTELTLRDRHSCTTQGHRTSYLTLCRWAPVEANRPVTRTWSNWSQSMEPKFHHRAHNSKAPVHILMQTNPIHTPKPDFPNVHFNTILPMPRIWQWLHSFKSSNQTVARLHCCYMLLPTYPPSFDYPDNIW
jgi:hypothetical protein